MRLAGQGLRSSPAPAAAWAAWRRSMFAAEGAKVVVAEFDEAAGDETVAPGRAGRRPGDRSSQADVSQRGRREGDGRPRRRRPTAGSTSSTTTPGSCPRPTTRSSTPTSTTWDQVMAVNVRGVFLGCKYAIPQMVEQGSGSVINIAQLRGARSAAPCPQDAYTASKGALLVADPQPRRPVRAARASAPTRSAPARSRRRCSWTGWSRTRRRSGSASPATRPAASASPRRSSTWRSTSPRTSRAGRTAPAGRRRRHHRQLLLGGGRDGALRSGSTSAAAGSRWRRRPRQRLRSPASGSASRRPCPSTPEAVVKVIARLVARIRRAAPDGPAIAKAPVGVGIPCVVIDGTTRSAANIDKGWVGFPAGTPFQGGRPPGRPRQRRGCGGRRRDALRGRPRQAAGRCSC